ncbi:gluconate:H+ symporter [Mucilaginibacter auburnensis]|uniref:Gnt-I system high-affinity gluconate transporter n=1 Tax=Mucilaginibacter auburnensis TaxID=1457233 RepID=A0A2H9VQL5_9SPHI|nr:gluconate:H+ symporter [Mucilaginibacter auburnensis]PJJ83122.1 Gnt-I system high-affinity gluconate transporter [Mucilaginibacter auburnensis]
MLVFILILCIGTLILLTTWAKMNVFLTFIIVSIMAAFLLGMPLEMIPKTIEKGIGGMLGSLVVVIVLGGMLGKLVGASGAAQRIATSMRNAFGEKYITWAMSLTGLIVGIPLYYNVGFFLLIPIIFSVAARYKLPLVYIGIPMLTALSVMHGFLPPHPSPMALTVQFQADIAMVFLYGFIIAVPTIILAGPIFAKTLKGIQSHTTIKLTAEDIPDEKLPSLATSILSSLLPVLLIGVGSTVATLAKGNPAVQQMAHFIADPNIAMVGTIIIATYTLGIRLGKSMREVMDVYADAIKEISLILLIIGSAGILKQVFIDTGVSDQIATGLQQLNMPPLLLGWIIAAILRVCLGPATVAGLAAAGIVFPLMQKTGADPNLMVLSVGAGSLFCSHVNDTSFWVFKEYFGLDMKRTFLSWSMMESLVSVLGLVGVLIINMFI